MIQKKPQSDIEKLREKFLHEEEERLKNAFPYPPQTINDGPEEDAGKAPKKPAK